MGADTFGEWPPSRPFLVVLSGPSGVGKTVLCRHLVEQDPSLVHSISATTRSPRGHERNGTDYYFWSEPEFRSAIQRGHFLEWAMVHGHLYGTPREPLEAELQRGRFPLLDVDVQGGRSVKAIIPDAVLILIAPPSAAALESRLRGRKTDAEPVIQERLAAASLELAEWERYDFMVVNDALEAAVKQVATIIAAERLRSSRRVPPSP
ncbi:MAG TPA: guanylate kinase [Dongiaceae bacterium]|jgi:guanylate kinase|nr:guanylate kinase [Dongiaceae bacterium]